MQFIFENILIAHIIIFLLILFIYVVLEKGMHIRSAIFAFKYKKTLKNATAAADVHSVIYFMICLATILYNSYKIEELPEDYSFWWWLLIMIVMVVVFNRLYYKFTNKDPDLKDDGYAKLINDRINKEN